MKFDIKNWDKQPEKHVLTKQEKIKGICLFLACYLISVLLCIYMLHAEERKLPDFTEADLVLKNCSLDKKYPYKPKGNNSVYHALDTSVLKNDVAIVEFRDTLEGAPENAEDVSETGNGHVLAWSEEAKQKGLQLIIAGDGKVIFPADCSRMFGEVIFEDAQSGFCNLKEVQVNGYLDTAPVENGSFLFSGCSELSGIEFMELISTENLKDASGMFTDCSSLTQANLSGLDLGNVTSLNVMFSGCSTLQSVDLSGLDLSSLEQTDRMFSGCSALKAVDVRQTCLGSASLFATFENCVSLETIQTEGLSAENLTSFCRTFVNCSSLQSADLSQLDTRSLRSVSCMFADCTALKTVDLHGLNTENLTDVEKMFSDCTSLEAVDIRGITLRDDVSLGNMFENCPYDMQLHGEDPCIWDEFCENTGAAKPLIDKEQFWEDFLRRGDHERWTKGWDPSAFSYRIKDMNGDGSPELLLQTPDMDRDDYQIWMFTLNNAGEPTLVLDKQAFGYICYIPADNGIMLISGPPENRAWLYEEIYELVGTELELRFRLQRTADMTLGNMVCCLIQGKQRISIDYGEFKQEHDVTDTEDIIDYWTPLLPEPVEEDSSHEDLSRYLGTYIYSFLNRFPYMSRNGSSEFWYTNQVLSAGTQFAEDNIYTMSLYGPGAPYSLLGIEVGMSSELAAQLAEKAGGKAAKSEGDNGEYMVFTFDDGSILRMRQERLQGENKVLLIELTNESQ